MRIFYSYILFLSILIQPVLNIGIVGYYQLNINEIIDKYCVNKDKPALNCDGKCYLSQQLNKVEDGEDKEGIMFQLENISPLFVYHTHQNNAVAQSLILLEKKSMPIYIDNYTSTYLSKILEPPRIA